MRYRKWLDYVVPIVLVGIGLISGGYVRHVCILCCIYVVLASGLNIIIGLGGRTCFAHAAFAIIGGYTCALMQIRLNIAFWIAFLVAGLLTMACGALIAIPALRTRGPYLALVTLGFAEIVRQISINAMNLTRGPLGIPGVPAPRIAGYSFGQEAMLVLCTLAAVLSVILLSRFKHSRFGRSLLAIREDELAAQAFGVNITSVTVMAFAFSAFFAGIGGALSATYISLISPDSFTIQDMFIMVCMVILGGSGTVIGPVLGAVVLGVLPELLRFLAEYRMLLFGALLVWGIRWRPAGAISDRLDEKLLGGFLNVRN